MGMWVSLVFCCTSLTRDSPRSLTALETKVGDWAMTGGIWSLDTMNPTATAVNINVGYVCYSDNYDYEMISV